jgi:hypothetical protein
MRRGLLEPRSQADLQFASRDDFQHLMLGMIAKLSPCSEERLLDVVAGRAGRKSLRSRNKSIRQSVRELQARRFVEIKGDQLVVTDAGRHLLQIMQPMRDARDSCGPDDLKAAASFDARSPPNTPSVKEVAAKQRQDAEPWEDAASEFGKAVEAMKRAESATPVEAPPELSSQFTLPDAVAHLGPEAQEQAPLELSPDLALSDAGADQGPLLTFEENLASSITERHGLGSGISSPVPLNQVYAWGERRAVIRYGPRFAWLIENIPRRMRAHVSVEAEVGVSSTIAPEVAAYPVGQGKTVYGIDVAQAMSLRLSAARSGIIIEAQSPETQWVWRSKSQSVNELAAWRFIITPTRRGSNSLRLAFSCKEIGPNGLLADSALPDRMLDIIVSTNLSKTLTQAAVWVTTLIVGSALGAYFEPAMQFISGLYQ